eukprot:UN31222
MIVKDGKKAGDDESIQWLIAKFEEVVGLTKSNKLVDDYPIVPLKREDFDFIDSHANKMLFSTLYFLPPSKGLGTAFWRIPRSYAKKDISEMASCIREGIEDEKAGDVQMMDTEKLLAQVVPDNVDEYIASGANMMVDGGKQAEASANARQIKKRGGEGSEETVPQTQNSANTSTENNNDSLPETVPQNNDTLPDTIPQNNDTLPETIPQDSMVATIPQNEDSLPATIAQDSNDDTNRFAKIIENKKP